MEWAYLHQRSLKSFKPRDVLYLEELRVQLKRCVFDSVFWIRSHRQLCPVLPFLTHSAREPPLPHRTRKHSGDVEAKGPHREWTQKGHNEMRHSDFGWHTEEWDFAFCSSGQVRPLARKSSDGHPVRKYIQILRTWVLQWNTESNPVGTKITGFPNEPFSATDFRMSDVQIACFRKASNLRDSNQSKEWGHGEVRDRETFPQMNW